MFRIGQTAKDKNGKTWMITYVTNEVVTLQCKQLKSFVDVLVKDLERGLIIPMEVE